MNEYMQRKAAKPCPPETPQRYTWRTIARHDTYYEANADISRRPPSTADCQFKIKRRGDRFEVRAGKPIKGDDA